MNRLLLILIAICLSSLNVYSQDADCIRKATFGSMDICLPSIDGYEECYLDPDVKSIADATEAPVNMVLGYYINNESYEAYDTIQLLNDFFKVYGTKQIQDLPATKKEIKEIGTAMKFNFLVKNWDEVTKQVEDAGLDVQVGIPTVVKSYNVNEESFTMLMIIKYEIEGLEPYDMCIAMNGFLSNDRMVWMAYYLVYEGKHTLKKVETNSNKILSVLQKAG